MMRLLLFTFVTRTQCWIYSLLLQEETDPAEKEIKMADFLKQKVCTTKAQVPDYSDVVISIAIGMPWFYFTCDQNWFQLKSGETIMLCCMSETKNRIWIFLSIDQVK